MQRHCLLILAASAVAINGCSDKSAGPQTYPVTGVVTQKGQPVEGAIVAFFAVAAADPSGRSAGGQAETGADGSFSIQSTFDQGKTTQEGLPPGDYKVTVIKLQNPGGAPSTTQPPKNVLPPNYATIETTPLSATVNADGSNKVDIPL